MLAAEVNHPRHLSVNGVKAELLVLLLLLVGGGVIWERQLKGLQEPRLVIIKICDAIHRYPALSNRWGTTMQ